MNVKCNPHPKAPHGFDRNASHNADRYVCECEGWDPYEAGYNDGLHDGLSYEAEVQEPVAILHINKIMYRDIHINSHEWIEWIRPKYNGMVLYAEPVEKNTNAHKEKDVG